jgi:hypothetical protein
VVCVSVYFDQGFLVGTERLRPLRSTLTHLIVIEQDDLQPSVEMFMKHVDRNIDKNNKQRFGSENAS